MLKRVLHAIVRAFTLVTLVTVPCRAEYHLLWGGAMGVGFCSASGHTCTVPQPLADFDGDGRLELVTVEGLPQSHVRIFDAMTGQLEGDVNITPVGLNMRVLASNLDFSGPPEIVVYGEGSTSEGAFFVIAFEGPTASVPVATPADAMPATAIHPNPFNPSATIDYSVPAKGKANIQIYDVAGRSVRTLLDGVAEPGQRSVVWKGRGDDGHQLPSGTYFYSLTLDGQLLDKGKAVILK